MRWSQSGGGWFAIGALLSLAELMKTNANLGRANRLYPRRAANAKFRAHEIMLANSRSQESLSSAPNLPMRRTMRLLGMVVRRQRT